MSFFSPVVIASLCCVIGFFKIAETRPAGGICGPRQKVVEKFTNMDKRLLWIKIQTKGRNPKNEKQGNDTVAQAGEGKLPGIVIACAMAQFLAAFSFTCMTSMTGLVWMILFNFGPTELGMFLTGVGVLSIFINVFGVKTAIKHIGAPRTIAIACILQTIGIAGYTFITPFRIHAIFFVCTINVGF